MRTPISLAIALLPAMAFAFVPTVDQKTVDAAAAIHADPAMKALLADLETPEAKDARFATHMEIVRIISPSRYELRRQAEITRRLTTDWGFDAKDIMSRTDGHLPGAGVQTVDGLPVYNVCVRIPGTYSQTPGAKNYKGQFPKVLIEGHIDTVNPPDLPPESKPYAPIKLAPASDPVVKTRDELAAIQDELHFDDKGYLTIKGPSDAAGVSRYEFETEVTLQDAEDLMGLCEPGIVDKTRYLVRSGKHVFEVDEFYGDNEGLVMAEVELSAEDEAFEKPDFIGREVTGDRRYYNSHLRAYPYKLWKDG